MVAYTFPSENAWLATPFWVLIGRFCSVARLTGIDPRVESKAMERDQVSGDQSAESGTEVIRGQTAFRPDGMVIKSPASTFEFVARRTTVAPKCIAAADGNWRVPFRLQCNPSRPDLHRWRHCTSESPSSLIVTTWSGSLFLPCFCKKVYQPSRFRPLNSGIHYVRRTAGGSAVAVGRVAGLGVVSGGCLHPRLLAQCVIRDSPRPYRGRLSERDRSSCFLILIPRTTAS